MALMNANTLLYGARDAIAYHQAIQLPDDVRAAMFQADRDIRARLRKVTRFVIDSGRAMSYASAEYRRAKQEPLQFELRFLRQGSVVYDTVIDPARRPPQQTDLDDGIYARTSFLSDFEPGLAATKYFELVETALAPLCKERGWRLVTNKDTCVRVVIDEKIHIDLPLYAVPDTEFVTLEKCFQDVTGLKLVAGSARLSTVLDGFSDIRIPTDRVMLAHRKKGWISSDPRALHDWFVRECERHGPQLRRTCRYLKGWRDFLFLEGGPASIALMACAVRSYKEGGWVPQNDRDDLAMLEIAKRLPVFFSATIVNPVLPDAEPLNDWDEVTRKRFVNAANDLHGHMHTALEGTANAEITVRRLQEALGTRVPYRPDLVRAFDKTPARAQVAAVVASPLPLRRPTTSA